MITKHRGNMTQEFRESLHDTSGPGRREICIGLKLGWLPGSQEIKDLIFPPRPPHHCALIQCNPKFLTTVIKAVVLNQGTILFTRRCLVILETLLVTQLVVRRGAPGTRWVEAGLLLTLPDVHTQTLV